MSRQKRKGSGFEREIVKWFLSIGVEAERVPLSGAAKGSYGADMRFGPAQAYTGECKRFANGLGKLYAALEQDDADVVFARADRKQTIACMPLETLEALLQEAGWAHKTLADIVNQHPETVSIPFRGAIR